MTTHYLKREVSRILVALDDLRRIKGKDYISAYELELFLRERSRWRTVYRIKKDYSSHALGQKLGIAIERGYIEYINEKYSDSGSLHGYRRLYRPTAKGYEIIEYVRERLSFYRWRDSREDIPKVIVP